MPAMTTEIIAILATFASHFTRPTWKNIQVLFIGAILCRGPRRVSSILRVMELASISNFSKYHRVLSRAKSVKGKRIQLKEFLNNINQVWQTDTINWYGDEIRQVQYITLICLWYHAGCAPVTVRIVLVKTPGGKNEAETFFSTDTALTPTQIIRYFVLRWNIEVTFEETRAHLGIETQRQWSDKAIARTTPLLMGLFSIITLIAFKMHLTKALVSQEMASWYNKQGELTFSDIIVIVRRQIWLNKYFSKSVKNNDFDKYSEKTIDTLLYQLSLAA